MVPRSDRAAPPARVAGRVGEDGMIDDDDYEAPPPRRPLLRRTRVLIPLGVLLAIFAAFLLLRTPDTDRDALIAKYGGAQAACAACHAGKRIHTRNPRRPAGPALLLQPASKHTPPQ